MALTVDKFTTAAQMDAVHAWCVASLGTSFVCSDGPPYPSRGDLAFYASGPFTVYVAHNGATGYGFAILDSTGQVLWLKHVPAQIKTVMRLLLGAARVDSKVVWGSVKNPVMRAALLANGCTPLPEQGPDAIIWSG